MGLTKGCCGIRGQESLSKGSWGLMEELGTIQIKMLIHKGKRVCSGRAKLTCKDGNCREQSMSGYWRQFSMLALRIRVVLVMVDVKPWGWSWKCMSMCGRHGSVPTPQPHFPLSTNRTSEYWHKSIDLRTVREWIKIISLHNPELRVGHAIHFWPMG